MDRLHCVGRNLVTRPIRQRVRKLENRKGKWEIGWRKHESERDSSSATSTSEDSTNTQSTMASSDTEPGWSRNSPPWTSFNLSSQNPSGVVRGSSNPLLSSPACHAYERMVFGNVLSTRTAMPSWLAQKPFFISTSLNTEWMVADTGFGQDRNPESSVTPPSRSPSDIQNHLVSYTGGGVGPIKNVSMDDSYEDDRFLDPHPPTSLNALLLPVKKRVDGHTPFKPSASWPTAGRSESLTGSHPEASQTHQSFSLHNARKCADFLTGHVLASATSTWHFPNMSEGLLLFLLSIRGFMVVPVSHPSSSQPGKSTHRSRGQSEKDIRGRRGRKPAPASRSTASKSSGKLGISKASRGVETPGGAILHFACPMSKHDVRRYASVYGPCTLPPGMPEYKRVKEHLKRYHSIRRKCPYCSTPWPNVEEFEEEFLSHLSTCPKVASSGIMSLPEHLTAYQQNVIEQDNHRNLPTDRAWTSLYRDLFPSERHIPSPYYDYFVPRYLVSESAQNVTSESSTDPGPPSAMTTNWTHFSSAPGRSDETETSNTQTPDNSASATFLHTGHDQRQPSDLAGPHLVSTGDTPTPVLSPLETIGFSGPPGISPMPILAEESSPQILPEFIAPTPHHLLDPQGTIIREVTVPSNAMLPFAQYRSIQPEGPPITDPSHMRGSGYRSGSDGSYEFTNSQENDLQPFPDSGFRFPRRNDEDCGRQSYAGTSSVAQGATVAQDTHVSRPRIPERIALEDHTIFLPTEGMSATDMMNSWLHEEFPSKSKQEGSENGSAE